MRRWVLAVGCVGSLCISGSLMAQEATVTEETKPLAGYAGGFFVRTPDDDFQLTVNGRFQPRHEYSRVPGPDLNTFKIRRARIAVTTKIFKHFETFTFVQHGSGNPTTTPVLTPTGQATITTPRTTYWWADATYRPMPQFGLTVGMISLPMDRQAEGSSGSMAMTEYPLTATQADGAKGKTIARQSLGLATTVGVRVFGDIGKAHYFVGLGNGEDEHELNTSTKDLAFSGRFAFDILGDPGYGETDLAFSETPKLGVGIGSGFEGQNAVDGHINTADIDWSWTSSADVAFKWRGMTFITEWYLRKLRVIPGTTSLTKNFTLDDLGYYAHAGYFVLPKKVELVVRAAQIFREGPDNNAYEFGGGVNWYIRGNNVKLQADFNRLLDFDETEGEGHQAFSRFRTMLTFSI